MPDLLSPFCGKAGFSPFMILSFLNFHVCSLPVPALQSGSLPLNLMASTGGITRSGKHKVSRSEERRVGKDVSVRVDLGGRRIIKKKIQDMTINEHHTRTKKTNN